MPIQPDNIGHTIVSNAVDRPWAQYFCCMVSDQVSAGYETGTARGPEVCRFLRVGPRIGRTDAERNCISNVRPDGLGYETAASSLAFLMNAARARQLSGVGLKNEDRYLEH